jgi:hypothetical protein
VLAAAAVVSEAAIPVVTHIMMPIEGAPPAVMRRAESDVQLRGNWVAFSRSRKRA